MMQGGEHAATTWAQGAGRNSVEVHGIIESGEHAELTARVITVLPLLNLIYKRALPLDKSLRRRVFFSSPDKILAHLNPIVLLERGKKENIRIS